MGRKKEEEEVKEGKEGMGKERGKGRSLLTGMASHCDYLHSPQKTRMQCFTAENVYLYNQR